MAGFRPNRKAEPLPAFFPACPISDLCEKSQPEDTLLSVRNDSLETIQKEFLVP